MQEAHNFCVENNIQYSLGYGSLIGAIRHKGFIPWDDDIDIIMTRPEYDKFCKMFKSNKGIELITPDKYNVQIAFARVCEMNKTLVEACESPWIDKPTGVWEDVLPIDAIAEKKAETYKTIDIAHSLWKATYPIRRANTPLYKYKSFVQRIKILLRRYFTIDKSANKRLVELTQGKQWGMSRCCANIAYPEYKYKDIHNVSVFENYIDTQFDGSTFKIVAAYDELLTYIYGDYMTLPPIDKRIRKNDSNVYYWK